MIAGVHDLGLFVATVFVLNATPGVDMVLTASRTLQHGRRGGLATALGISAGCIVHTLAAAFGLAALIAASAAAFEVVRWVGAAYLAWLAFGLLRAAARPGASSAASAAPEAVGTASAAPAAAPRGGSAPAAPTPSTPAPLRSRAALFREGLLTNVLNPKIALFFLALLPQFIDAATPDKTAAFLALGALMALQGTLFLFGFVALVARLGRLGTRPGVRRGLQAAGGLVFAVLAARLALAARP